MDDRGNDGVDWREKFERRVFVTYLSRLYAHNRLRVRGSLWEAALISLSTSSSVAAITLIANPGLYGDAGPTLFAVSALLTLVASLVLTNRDYGGRSRDLFDSYRAFQRLSVDIERLRAEGCPSSDQRFNELDRQYQDLLDRSENHVEADYFRAIKNELSGSEARSGAMSSVVQRGLSVMPCLPILYSVAICIPASKWLIENL